MKNLGCDPTFQLIENWDKIRKLKNHHIEVGSVLFRHLFDKHPEIKRTVLGFSAAAETEKEEEGSSTTTEDMMKETRFLQICDDFVENLERIIEVLGPDHELIEENIGEMGCMFACIGLRNEDLPLVKESLFYALGLKLKTNFKKNAWNELYTLISDEMEKKCMLKGGPPKQRRRYSYTLTPGQEKSYRRLTL